MPGFIRRYLTLPGLVRALALLFVGATLCITGPVALAQQSQIELDIQSDYLGIGGVVQRGTWTPVRMDLTNTSAEVVEVNCRWILSDDDGDELIAERRNISLNPQRPTGVWLYANPPMSTRPNETWVFQAVDADSGKLLTQAQLQLVASAMIEPSVNLVGVCGFKSLGLNPWQRWSTQHEQIRMVRGLNIETLPDRWYGMDPLTSLVWFPVEGGEPTASRMSDATKRALREWVYRGGHLVIVMPYGGQQWTSADSGLADLFAPIDATDIKQTQARPPISVFGVLAKPDPVPMLWFDLQDAPEYSTLATAIVPITDGAITRNEQRPLIVGRRLGFGQVTLVGIDLSEASVLQSLDAFRLHRVWTYIFSWRASKVGELLPPKVFENPQTANQYVEAKNAQHIEIGNWIAGKVARQGETAAPVGLAFILFIVYAIVAALTFPNLLRARGWERHSWVLFVGIVALFSVIAWGGAWVMRPLTSSAAHFTLLDIDGNTNLARAKSWQSVLIPSFATADIAVPSDSDSFPRMDLVNLISSPGHTLSPESPGYPDRQTYAFDAANPNNIPVPMRSTTKSLVIDYLGTITAKSPGLDKPWTLPKASLRIANNGLPAGTITHNFPGDLQEVHVIYCPGGAQQLAPPNTPMPPNRPMVYKYINPTDNKSIWEAGTPIALPAVPAAYQPLWKRPTIGTQGRPWKNEGFLGNQIQMRGFNPNAASDTAIMKDVALLSFYDALPPPIYENSGGFFQQTHTYSRSMARDFDLTRLITGRRIIIIGHLKLGPSPVPLTVDGESVESEGWTVVRWIYDL